uniref:Uncharacterized protein n=1 Tax=Tanacetum cinerariifolium TaxID=118510 RepID=A0A6L2M1N1_TANCI|nr:hypothetical protein [Tanacetum cinerariifolium]
MQKRKKDERTSKAGETTQLLLVTSIYLNYNKASHTKAYPSKDMVALSGNSQVHKRSHIMVLWGGIEWFRMIMKRIKSLRRESRNMLIESYFKNYLNQVYDENGKVVDARVICDGENGRSHEFEDDDTIFTLDEPFEEMGSEVVEVHALKEEEIAKITVLGEHVSFPNGIALSFALRQVQQSFPWEST